MTVNLSSTADSIKDIQRQFNAVLAYSQGIEHPETDKLFDTWLEAKRDFIKAWGGKLIYQVPEKITFELSQKDKNSRLTDFILRISSVYDNNDLAQFIADNRNGFFDNKVITPWTIEEIEIPKGMKLVKAFKYFEDDLVLLEKLQIEASRIIQEDKVEGYLCFSVHPLDFLSSSENTHNWRSCHSLDGEYRAGNLSYMVDKSTIVCYLHSLNHTKLPNFPPDVLWNSKKWRMLMFFSKDWHVAFAGRQYPFFSRSALDTITRYLSSTVMSGHWSYWHNDMLNSFNYAEQNSFDGGRLMWNYICIRHELFRLDEVVRDEQYSLHFNDVLRSSCYIPYYAYKIYGYYPEPPSFSIGGAVPCCHCGKNHIVAPDTLLCEECELEFGSSQDLMFGYCDLCDCRMNMNNSHYISAYSTQVCEHCYDENVRRCEGCGEELYADDLMYDRPTQSYRCSCCHSSHRARRDLY